MDQPRIRAGDADRQQMVAQLGRHLGEGRLTVTEFDERAARAHQAVYLDELPRWCPTSRPNLDRPVERRVRARGPHGPRSPCSWR